MAKMKVSEMAKALNITSKELISFLNMNGFEDVKSANKFVEDDAIALIMKSFASKMQDGGKASSSKKTTKRSADSEKKKNEVKSEHKIEQIKEEQEKIQEKKIEATQVEQKKQENNIISKKKVQKEPKENLPDEKIIKAQELTESQKATEIQKQAEIRKERETEEKQEIIEEKQISEKPESRKKETVLKKQEAAVLEKKETAVSEKTESNVGEKKEEKRSTGNNQSRNNSERNSNNNSINNNNNNRYHNNDRNHGEGKSDHNNERNRNNDRNNQNRGNSDRSRNDRNDRSDRNDRNEKNGQNRSYDRNNRNENNRGGDRRQNRNNDRNDRGDRNDRNNQNRGNDRNNGQGRNDRNNQGRGNDRNNGQGRNDRNGQNRSSGRSNNNYGSLAGFAASPLPTKDTNNRNNGYNKKKNNQRDDDEREIRSKKKDPNRKGAFQMPKPVPKPKEEEETIKTITIPEKLTLKELAEKMKQQPAAIIKKLFLQGKMVSINQEITFEEAEEIALEYNCIAELEEKVDIVAELLKEDEEDPTTLKKRPPVVCVMGHVDHGKTSLLDAIRETNVTSHEAGGITQHIGAYTVDVNGEKITFLDTPGHEAFTSMRMRGANSTDIAILVVAADDGVMPQTIEAINHAKAAGIEIIVAVNKIDKPSANIERVKQELVEYELIAEDWGGTTIFVPVSAHTKEGIDSLLEMILLTADVCELKANPDRKARGIVIEARLDKGRGPVATLLVQKGTMHAGDSIVIGSSYGRIRAMTNDRGQRIKEAYPSTPVEIIGLNEVPAAGEIFMVTENEKEARNIASAYITQSKEKLIDDTRAKLSLDGLFSQIQAGNIKELNLIVKADVQGSVEAVKQSLMKLTNEEVAIRVIHGGVGNINESDVSLASASNAIIIGFNVKPDSTAKDIADREKVDLRMYKVIYNAIEDVEAAMKGMLDPIYEEKVLGHAEVRQTFKASGVGLIAGSYVLDGKIIRGSKARILRNGELLFDGPLASLKRFKDDVKEVAAGYECGLVFEGFHDFQVEDQIEAYIMEEVPR